MVCTDRERRTGSGSAKDVAHPCISMRSSLGDSNSNRVAFLLQKDAVFESWGDHAPLREGIGETKSVEWTALLQNVRNGFVPKPSAVGGNSVRYHVLSAVNLNHFGSGIGGGHGAWFEIV
mmetsp:Transcript_22285/g.46468  ORF Transcript_22285/g.46468 Transcript_22285/m.46468 type:complete len:120 (-) Transcript_22285:142-501(-)